MKFVFKFASLLKVRRYEVDREQQKLAKLLNEKDQLEKKMHLLKRKLFEFGELADSSTARNVAEIRKGYEFKKDLQDKIWQIEQKVTAVNEDIISQRKKLLEAKKQFQIFEKLEKRDRAKFVKKVLDFEQKQQNNIAIQMYNRNAGVA